MRLAVKDSWWGATPFELPDGAEPVGYAWMVRRFALNVMPHHRWSFVGPIPSHRSSFVVQEIVWETFSLRYAPSGEAEQIEFALKYDGLNLEILRACFDAAPAAFAAALVSWLEEKPTSAYARRAWYLYEQLQAPLPLPDANRGAYVPLLDPEAYFVGPARRSPRHKVEANLLGEVDFCVMIRRSAALDHFASEGWPARAKALLEQADPDLAERAVTWLYTKETRSSFEMEREVAPADKARRFVVALRQAQGWPELGKADLLRLQNLIVTDPRNQDQDYRDSQNYVSQGGAVEPDFISPRPEELPALMEGWLRMLDLLLRSEVDPAVAAAAAAFSFVYLHPFEDGNGRIHRFLIHYVLSRRGFSPPGSIVPVSATMLAKMREYDAALERFSVPLMQRLDWEADEWGGIEVRTASSGFYRAMDLSRQAEALAGWLRHSIEVEMARELRFVAAYREARRQVAELVELPDRLAEPLVARCMEQGGRLSKARRARQFQRLTDEEVVAIEAAIRAAMLKHGLDVAEPRVIAAASEGEAPQAIE